MLRVRLLAGILRHHCSTKRLNFNVDELECAIALTYEQKWGFVESVPVLFVVGEDDRDCPADAQLAWADAWTAEVRRYPGMSHVGPLLGVAAPAGSMSVRGRLKAVAPAA